MDRNEVPVIQHTGNGASMVERTNEQQRVLEKRRADLAERRKAERSAAQELEAKEEQGEELEKTYTSLQAEVRENKVHKLPSLQALSMCNIYVVFRPVVQFRNLDI